MANKHNLPIHLDGARLFNAAIYLGVEAQEIARYCDSVMISLSKGLGAPGFALGWNWRFYKRSREVSQNAGEE